MIKAEFNVYELDLLKAHLVKVGITFYKLAKMIGMPKSTMYSYKDGHLGLPVHKCARIADVLNVEVTDLFPQIKTFEQDYTKVASNMKEVMDKSLKKGGIMNMFKKDEEVKSDEVRESEKLTMTDMVAGASELCDEAGNVLMVRAVMNSEMEIFSGYVIQPDDQCIVLTGIKESSINPNRTLVKVDDKLARVNQIEVNPFPIIVNKEVGIVIRCNGEPKMLSRKTIIGTVFYF